MKFNINKCCFILLLAAAGGTFSCKKYLDARPDKTQVVPSTLTDLEALLSNVNVMNRSFPNYGEAASDDYYITATDYNALSLARDQTLYSWNPKGIVPDGQWESSYQVAFYANEVLENLVTIPALPGEQAAQVKGAALFFRAYAFLEAAGLFAKHYDPATAGTDPGIALRLTSDFNARSVRASNQQSYAQILADFKQAIRLLPLSGAFPSQPTRAAGYAGAARALLSMGEYAQAGLYADSCLSLGPPLMDYNKLSITSANPIARFNQETIFYAMSTGTSLLAPAKCKADSSLYRSYAANDLRKSIFFKSNNNGTYAFKGNYDGEQSSVIFSGLATDEIYLISAECAARAGQTTKAMQMLNTLLTARFRTGTFQPLQAADAQSALTTILNERRKELIFRGSRWTDLKRLNYEDQYKVTLQRNLGGTTFTLPPNDPRYELLIPQDVISLTGMVQNPR